MALLVTLLLLLALSSLSAGMLWLATTQNVTATARARHVRLRLDVEAAVLDAFARWQTPRARHAVGERWILQADSSAVGATTVLADRLTPTLTLLRATGTRRTPAGLTAIVRVGLLVRTIQPEELLRSFPAALTADAVTLGQGALVDADAPDAPPDGRSSVDCPDDGTAALDSLYDGQLPAVATSSVDAVQQDASALLRGQPPISVTPGPLSPEGSRLGPIPWDLVPQIADLVVGGTLRPAPAQTQDRCAVERPDNWGEPGGAGPCAGHAPVIYAPDGVVMAGGTGQGILVVRGDAVLRDGARFYGAVLASHSLLVNDSAQVIGAARAGSATILGGGVHYRVCALWQAVLGAPALRRAFRPAGRWWLPDYVRAP